MIQISKRLTSFIWYAPPLTLSGNFLNKNRINVLRVINGAGAGYLSWQKGRPVNSLTIIQTGAVVTLDALGVVASDANTWFNIDNGNAPVPPSKQLAPDVYDLVVDADEPLVVDSWHSVVYFNRVVGNVSTIGITPPGDPALDFTLAVSINGGAYIDLPSSNYAFDAVNQAIQALDDSAVAAGYTLAFRCTRNLPIGVYFTIYLQL